ncbi:MAG: hypothetical protein K2Z81_18610, partial [Cyanobacteria bacterium]|nr:hypothetical protein [Cyanobacteriota bacterium]
MEQETAASPETSDQSKPNKLIPLPDVGDIFFLDILYILLGVRPEYLFQDASVGWHLVAGKWILENHAIPQTDLFSYTFPDKTWIAYEWLFDVVIYVLTMLGGLNLLAVATGSLIALIILRTYDRTRFAGTPLLIAFVLMILGTFSSAIHWLARPHIVTMFGVYFFCKTLEQFYQSKISRKKLLALLIIMMVLWVNSHPAFLLGIAFVGLYMVCSCLSWFFYKGEPEGKGVRAQRAVTLIIALALVALATLINPYGLKLHAYIFDYLNSNQAILAATDEFRSPNFHNNISTAFFEALILLLITGLVVTEKRVSFPSISA